MAMGTVSRDEKSVEKLRDLIKGIKVAMLATIEADGIIRSRPMVTQENDFEGDLWFFSIAGSPKVDEVKEHRQVNVSYMARDRYVSVSGAALVIRDRAKIDELWNPAYKAWFPKGKDDPELALLKVSVSQAEYWESPSSAVVKLAGFAKALATRQRYEGGDNEKLNLTK